MPINDACYLSGTDKIYGVTSNYIIKFNATTGLSEASSRVCAPMYGPMRIAGSGTDLFVSSIYDYTENKGTGGSNNHQIWTINPNTLAATNTLGFNSKLYAYLGSFWGNGIQFTGAGFMQIYNGDLWFYEQSYSGNAIARINIINPADYQFPFPFFLITHSNWNPEQFDIVKVGGDDLLYLCDPAQNEAEEHRLTPAQWFYNGYSDATPNYPNACVYVPSQGKAYGVTGTENLMRFDDYSLNTSTTFNLGTVQANVKPCRIRLGPDGKLYIPCQQQDVIIVWNPVTNLPGDAVLKTGFDSPIDVVFTGSKIWAIQSGLKSLKEIV